METIMAGDFNAHNIIWNCQNTDVMEIICLKWIMAWSA